MLQCVRTSIQGHSLRLRKKNQEHCLLISQRNITNREKLWGSILGKTRLAPSLPNVLLFPTKQFFLTFLLASLLLQEPIANLRIKLQVRSAVLLVFPLTSGDVVKTRRLC